MEEPIRTQFDRPPGAYIMDKDGNLIPDISDPAMKERIDAEERKRGDTEKGVDPPIQYPEGRE